MNYNSKLLIAVNKYPRNDYYEIAYSIDNHRN